MWSHKKGRDQTKEKREKKESLKKVFISYAERDVLNKEQLKNAFEHLEAALPYKQAEEALSVADTNNDDFISCSTLEFDKLVDYAYNKGYRYNW
ncbi:hypothetical protein V6N13_058454 [Hibiscus sabdariffa]|uniref:EF-hand domain-containing protein n=1 Tax=Hibiscus sabdariffa TaxID=183260 RepID=A0ABR2GG33_9ROSI